MWLRHSVTKAKNPLLIDVRHTHTHTHTQSMGSAAVPIKNCDKTCFEYGEVMYFAIIVIVHEACFVPFPRNNVVAIQQFGFIVLFGKL